MKYSDGCYLFRTEYCYCSNIDVQMKNITFRSIFSKRAGGFDCYSFSYYETEQYSLDFDEAAIWIDKDKNILIVFTRNEKLLDYMILYMMTELGIHCKPLNVGIHSFVLQDGKGVLTSIYKQTSTNKVTTSLMRTDTERINLIEKLIVGDFNERIFERNFCYPERSTHFS
ncbi:hypothetical protein [Jeotgalibacillus sp. R-1-5s-1]|uniref:hypothetical protein n=1 Tax=Jeotgalibacillus sp. R-1-5s-1 TaxID=2555897 RepID=UPI00106994FC|nr:hypothetical protein [Jeotgalibacillus sp. R-1-5s-1]TFD94315.1 hypothetical protein E2491_12775 [Jeotgalibacillus sp. R-1-5s-1]